MSRGIEHSGLDTGATAVDGERPRPLSLGSRHATTVTSDDRKAHNDRLEIVRTVNVLISVDELATRLDSGSPPAVLDVRWALGDRRGRDHYLAGHLPGAVYVDLETELAGPPSPQEGRHPLPTIEDLQTAARR